MDEVVSDRGRDAWRRRALELLRDAENVANCRHTRQCACFDAIYIRLLLAANVANPRPGEHPTERVIIAGAAACGLDDDETGEVLDLHEAVTARRYEPNAFLGNLLRLLAIARQLVRSTMW